MEEESNRQFCSRLVSQSYEFAGILLVTNANYCYPKDIESSPLLYEVKDCVRAAEAHEVEFALSESPLEIQAIATNKILARARQLSGVDIQNFEQLAKLLMEHPEYDDEITSITKQSGYLTLWQMEYQCNSWRYDSQKFSERQIARDSKIFLAIDELAAAEEQLAQYKHMHGVYMLFWQQSSLKYFAQEILLYQTLVEITTQRVVAAKHVRDNA